MSWFPGPMLARAARDGMVKHQEEEAKKAAANPAPAAVDAENPNTVK